MVYIQVKFKGVLGKRILQWKVGGLQYVGSFIIVSINMTDIMYCYIFFLIILFYTRSGHRVGAISTRNLAASSLSSTICAV